jgi:hypothetical protein
MKKYLVIQVTHGLLSGLASQIESTLNAQAADGYQMVNMGYTVDSENKPCCIITFCK